MSAGRLKGLAASAGGLLLISGMVVAPALGGETQAPVRYPALFRRAPLPGAGEGLIWFHDRAAGKLVAMDPTGRRKREVDVKDCWSIRAISPPLNKLWFAGKDGRPPAPRGPRPAARHGGPPAEERLTLHVREIDGKAEGTDLGVEVPSFSIVSPDGKAVGLVVRKRRAAARGPLQFENSLVDVATKRVTKLDLPANHQLTGIAPDRSWVLSLEYNVPAAEGVPPYRIYSLAVAGGKPRLLSGKLSVMFGTRISPDCKRVLMFAVDPEVERSKRAVAAYIVEVSTGRPRRIAGHEKQLWSSGIWSPDGKRIAYAWRERNDDGKPVGANGIPPTRVEVCDADGKNARTVLTTKEMIKLLGWW